MRTIRQLTTALTLVFVFGAATAQPPAFETVSIKLADPNARGYGIRRLAGRIIAGNVSLKNLIGETYGVHESQIVGPKWIESERYNVEATVAGGVTLDSKTVRKMLQPLLADRFELRIRHEPKVTAYFALETVKGGHKLSRPAGPDRPPSFRLSQRRLISAENDTLEDLTEALTWLMGRPVIDRTGLEGSFDYKLEWSPDEMQTRSQEAPVETDGKSPSLASALQLQLGLKLTAKKEPLDQIIVDKAERPSAN